MPKCMKCKAGTVADAVAGRIVINKEDYFGMAAEGLRNYDLWNVAHVVVAPSELHLPVVIPGMAMVAALLVADGRFCDML